MELMEAIERYESEVRSYVRNFPTVFEKAQGSYLYDVDGNAYLDFFAGASVLNYGHNHPELKKVLIEYLAGDNITHSLDMASRARAEFLMTFHEKILKPRGLNHRVQFPGPTGANAVESALKIARKSKGRQKIIAFTNAFHGMTLGALSVTGNAFKRAGAGLSLTHSDPMPFDGYMGEGFDTIDYLDRVLDDGGSGVDQPAAVITETVQAEGGVNIASVAWLRNLQQLCRKHDMLLIVDDIQAGCGRTGKFFSFEEAEIDPDLITISKSLSGYGLPFSLTLVKPEYDIWEPGEHNGTFRGHNPAMVTAKRAIDLFWSDSTFSQEVTAKGKYIREALKKMASKYPETLGTVRGRGMLQAIEFMDRDLASTVSKKAFKLGLIIETAGPADAVLKLMPPLTIAQTDLDKGLQIIDRAIVEAMQELDIGAPQAAGQ